MSEQKEPIVPAVIIPFPIKSSLPRAAIEATVEWLIELLDAADAPTEDCEPETGEESDDGEVETWPEWHAGLETRSPG